MYEISESFILLKKTKQKFVGKEKQFGNKWSGGHLQMVMAWASVSLAWAQELTWDWRNWASSSRQSQMEEQLTGMAGEFTHQPQLKQAGAYVVFAVLLSLAAAYLASWQLQTCRS